jgi:hypothetical protein
LIPTIKEFCPNVAIPKHEEAFEEAAGSSLVLEAELGLS